MKVEGKDVIITDPCYIAKDEDWGDSFNWEDHYIEPFSEYEWEDTGYGDGSPKVFSIPSYYDPSEFLKKMSEEGEREELENLKEYIGQCGVDSGSFGVFLLDEALEYNPNFLDSLPNTCYHIVRDFSGIIYSAYDEEENTHFILKPFNPIIRPIITD